MIKKFWRWLTNRNLIIGMEKRIDLLNKGMESQCDLMDELKQENRQLKAEVERLKEGKFTNEEINHLCHNRHEREPECTVIEFETECDKFTEELRRLGILK